MKPENEAQDMKMGASSWLNWPPAFQFIVDAGQERIAPVISVLSAQDASDNQTAQPDILIVQGKEVESRPESIPTSRSNRLDDPTVVEAFQEVAELLAAAYLRYQKIQRMPVNPPADVSQIMRLVYLAPNIQIELLYLPPTPTGRFPVSETSVRKIAGLLSSSEQRTEWARIKSLHCLGQSTDR